MTSTRQLANRTRLREADTLTLLGAHPASTARFSEISLSGGRFRKTNMSPQTSSCGQNNARYLPQSRAAQSHLCCPAGRCSPTDGLCSSMAPPSRSSHQLRLPYHADKCTITLLGANVLTNSTPRAIRFQPSASPFTEGFCCQQKVVRGRSEQSRSSNKGDAG